MRAHVIDELNTRFYPVDKLEQVLWWAMSWLVSKWMREKQMGVSQDAPPAGEDKLRLLALAVSSKRCIEYQSGPSPLAPAAGEELANL